MTRVVVFGYHEVGARCLRVLLDARQSIGLEIPLVVTHQDPNAQPPSDQHDDIMYPHVIPFIGAHLACFGGAWCTRRCTVVRQSSGIAVDATCVCRC